MRSNRGDPLKNATRPSAGVPRVSNGGSCVGGIGAIHTGSEWYGALMAVLDGDNLLEDPTETLGASSDVRCGNFRSVRLVFSVLFGSDRGDLLPCKAMRLSIVDSS